MAEAAFLPASTPGQVVCIDANQRRHKAQLLVQRGQLVLPPLRELLRNGKGYRLTIFFVEGIAGTKKESM